MDKLRGVYDDIRPLFRGGDGDLVRMHLLRIKDRDRSGRWRKEAVKFDFGDLVEAEAMILAPINEQRHFSGSQLTQAILKRYNDDYWLLSLWNKLVENARESRLGLDLVRAFVKHGIYLTGEELVTGGRIVTYKLVADNGLADRVTYYKRLFTWRQIVKCLRYKQRKAIVQRLRNDGSTIKAFRLRYLKTQDILERLPEVNQILGYAQLPLIARDAKEQTENLQPILRWVYLNWHFWRRSKKLRAELAAVLKFNTPLSYNSL